MDYSKWDHFGSDDSDSDHQYEKQRPVPNVRVTRLEEPSTIQVLADQSIAIVPQTTSTDASSPATTTHHPSSIGGSGASPIEPEKDEEARVQTTIPQHRTNHQKDHNNNNSPPAVSSVDDDNDNDPAVWYTQRHGSYVRVSSAPGLRYGWIQDRTTVTLRWELPCTHRGQHQERKPTYTVSLTHTAPDKYSAGASEAKSHLRVVVQTTTNQDESTTTTTNILIDSDLYCPVYLPTEHDGDVDWEVVTAEKTTWLVVTLYKAMPTQLVSTVWWKRCLLAYEQKDAVMLPTVSQQHVQAAWEAAHASVLQGRNTSDDDDDND